VVCRQKTGRWVRRNIYASPNSGKKPNITFADIDIILHIYLFLMCSNCSGGRSFSKLKRIKNELRSSVPKQRLNHLLLMSGANYYRHKTLTNWYMNLLAKTHTKYYCSLSVCLTWWEKLRMFLHSWVYDRKNVFMTFLGFFL